MKQKNEGFSTRKTGSLRICERGHSYYKSSDCPTCPVCEESRKPDTDFLSLLAAPARRALENAHIYTLEELAAYTEKDLLKLHGMGKSSIPILRKELEKVGLNFVTE